MTEDALERLANETTECWRCGEQRYTYESCHHCGGSCKPMNRKKQEVETDV